MSELKLGSSPSGSIQPEGTIQQPEKAKVDATPPHVTSAVAKGGKEEPKGLGDRIFTKLKDIFGSKSESTANTPSLKFSQKVLGMLVPGKKDLTARANRVAEQKLKQNPEDFSELSSTLTTKPMTDSGDMPPSDLPPPLPDEHSDTSFPEYAPPEFTEQHLPGGALDDNAPIPTDLPPTLLEEAKTQPKPLPKRPEKHEDAAPTTLSQESIAARIRPGQNPITGSDAVKAKKVGDAQKAEEIQKAQVESRNKQLGFLMAEFPKGEKIASKSMGEVPKLIDALMSDSIDKPLLQTMPRLTKRLNDYKANYKNAEEASKKFDQKLEAIIQNNSLDPLDKCAEFGKLYASDFKEYANALSASIVKYSEFLEDTQGFGARPVPNDPISTKVSIRLTDSGAAPMQRIMRHGLLLGEMVKSMPKEDPRRADLEKVLNEVLELTNVINNKVS